MKTKIIFTAIFMSIAGISSLTAGTIKKQDLFTETKDAYIVFSGKELIAINKNTMEKGETFTSHAVVKTATASYRIAYNDNGGVIEIHDNQTDRIIPREWTAGGVAHSTPELIKELERLGLSGILNEPVS